MDGVNFAEIEQHFVREKINPCFTWKASDEYSPLNPMTVPLSEATVAFVTTCGAHLSGDQPFDIRHEDGDPSFRSFPSSTPFGDLSLIHRGYDTERASADMNVVLPLEHLREAQADGRIGRLAPTVYSFMGFVADTAPLLTDTAPAVAQRLHADNVDLVLLAPT